MSEITLKQAVRSIEWKLPVWGKMRKRVDYWRLEAYYDEDVQLLNFEGRTTARYPFPGDRTAYGKLRMFPKTGLALYYHGLTYYPAMRPEDWDAWRNITKKNRRLRNLRMRGPCNGQFILETN